MRFIYALLITILLIKVTTTHPHNHTGGEEAFPVQPCIENEVHGEEEGCGMETIQETCSEHVDIIKALRSPYRNPALTKDKDFCCVMHDLFICLNSLPCRGLSHTIIHTIVHNEWNLIRQMCPRIKTEGCAELKRRICTDEERCVSITSCNSDNQSLLPSRQPKVCGWDDDAAIVKICCNLQFAEGLPDETDPHLANLQEKLEMTPGAAVYYFGMDRSTTTVQEKDTEQSVEAFTLTKVLYLKENIDRMSANDNDALMMWHAGANVLIRLIYPCGKQESLVLGDTRRYHNAQYKVIIPGGAYSGIEVDESTGNFAVFTVLAAPVSVRRSHHQMGVEEMIAIYPQHEQLIRRLTSFIPNY